MNHITINNEETFRVMYSSSCIEVDEESFEWEYTEYEPNRFHILYKGRVYHIEVLSERYSDKVFFIKINRKIVKISVNDKWDLLLNELGMSTKTSQKLSDIIAPMPGLVVDIFISKGQRVQKGDKLFVLEAMKMENVIVSQGEGIIKDIAIRKKDKVEKNQFIISFK